MLHEWDKGFDGQMRPYIVPDSRGKGGKVTIEMVRMIVEQAQALKTAGRRIRIDSFGRSLWQKGVGLSKKTIGEILVANDLYRPQLRKRRPRFYQSLCQAIPNGLLGIDGSEFVVWLGQRAYRFNVELAVDIHSFYHSAFSVAQQETSQEVIKVLEGHRVNWGIPLGVLFDHDSANLSDQTLGYLQGHGIEVLPVGPGNPKGNGSLEGAFGEMKRTLGTIRLSDLSPRSLAKTVLEKIVEIYITLRNRISLQLKGKSPEQAFRTPVRAQDRNQQKERLNSRRQKVLSEDLQTKVDRLHWFVNYHGMEVDAPSLKRARHCIGFYDLETIHLSEEAFLRAIRRDSQRRSLAYFFGILNRIQNERDVEQYRHYCKKRYDHQQMLKNGPQQKKDSETATLEDLLSMLKATVSSPLQDIREISMRQARRMAKTLKQQRHYQGGLKRQISDALGTLKDLNLTQKQEAWELAIEFLN